MKNEYRIEKPNKTLSTEEMEFFKMRTVSWRAEAAHTHVHDAIEVIYMNKGSVQVSIDGVKTSIYPGDVALFRSRAIHDIWTEDEVENDYYVLKLLPKTLYNMSLNGNDDSFPLRFLICNPALKTIWRKEEIAGTDIELGFNRLIDSLDSKKNVTTLSRIISGLMVLEALYSSDNESMKGISLTNDSLYFALFYINEHYREDISLQVMAQSLGYNPSYISRYFKSSFKIGISQYITVIRLRKAVMLMQDKKNSITYCAFESGFPSMRTFYRAFLKEFGCTPGEYLKGNLE